MPLLTVTSHIHARPPSGPISHTERHGRVERISASYPTGPGFSSGTRRNSSTTVSFHILSNLLFTNHHTTRRYTLSATDEHYVVGYATCTETSEKYGSSLHRVRIPGIATCSSNKLGHDLFCIVVLRLPHKSRMKQMTHSGWVGDGPAGCCHSNVLPTGSAVEEVSVVLQCCQWMVCCVCRYVHVTWANNIKRGLKSYQRQICERRGPCNGGSST